MKRITFFIFFLSSLAMLGQKTATDFGFKEMHFSYKDKDVAVLVKSAEGEEEFKKPILLFCQGSLPQPLIKYDDTGQFGVFPFDDSLFLNEYHLVIIAKPGIPVIAHSKNLTDNFIYEEDGSVPEQYLENNHLDFYVDRNNYILKKLLQEDWAEAKGLVVAGHSEGSYIAAKMAAKNKKISRVIFSGGNPYGRISSILAQDRYYGKTSTIEIWRDIVDYKHDTAYSDGDSSKTTYSFSEPVHEYLEKLKIPVLVSYGTKDWSAPYNDLLQVNMIREAKDNFTFLVYDGLEHNYFPVDENMKPKQEEYNWNRVAEDWLLWLIN